MVADNTVNPSSIQLAPTTPWMYGAAGGVTTLPVGTTVLTDTLYIDNQFGPVLTGAGEFLSTIDWQGPPDRPVIALRNCTMADIGNFTIKFSQRASHAIVLANLPSCPPGTVTSTKCRIHDVWIEAGTYSQFYIGDGIRIDSSYFGGPDQNNELHRIERCRITGFSGAAVSILSSQSHQNVISDCEFGNSHIPPVGIGVYARFGSQTMTRCNGGNLQTVFVGLDQYAGAGIVTYNNFEGCARFIALAGSRCSWEVAYNRCDGLRIGTDPVIYADATFAVNFHHNTIGCSDQTPITVQFDRYSSGLFFCNNLLGSPVKPKLNVWTNDQNAVIPASSWVANNWLDSSQGTQPLTLIPHP